MEVLNGGTMSKFDLLDKSFADRIKNKKCKCRASTGICGCVTFGTDKLSDLGYWSVECSHGFAFVEYDVKCSHQTVGNDA